MFYNEWVMTELAKLLEFYGKFKVMSIFCFIIYIWHKILLTNIIQCYTLIIKKLMLSDITLSNNIH